MLSTPCAQALATHAGQLMPAVLTALLARPAALNGAGRLLNARPSPTGAASPKLLSTAATAPAACAITAPEAPEAPNALLNLVQRRRSQRVKRCLSLRHAHCLPPQTLPLVSVHGGSAAGQSSSVIGLAEEMAMEVGALLKKRTSAMGVLVSCV